MINLVSVTKLRASTSKRLVKVLPARLGSQAYYFERGRIKRAAFFWQVTGETVKLKPLCCT